jgi:hypothetical protein
MSAAILPRNPREGLARMSLPRHMEPGRPVPTLCWDSAPSMT